MEWQGQAASTAIWNRESILELLGRELARNAHEGRDLFVLLVGLDEFHSLSQQYGSAERDQALGEIAKRASAFLQGYDHIGRYGSEQLLVLPLSADLMSILPLAEKLRDAVAHQPLELSGGRIPLTVSISLATSSDFPSRTPHDLLQELESALNRAQAAGGNRVETVHIIRPRASTVPSTAREEFPVRLVVCAILLAALVALFLIKPAASCAPFRLHDIYSAGELPPPLPTNCDPSSEAPSGTTLQALDKQRESRGLQLQERISCKISIKPQSRRASSRDEQWLSSLYVDGVYQYHRQVFLAAWQDVPGGRLFTIEVCLMPWWSYVTQPGDACWSQYAFWK